MSITFKMHATGKATPSKFAAMLSRRVPFMTGFTITKPNEHLRISGNNPKIIDMLKGHEAVLRMSDNILEEIDKLINEGSHTINVILYTRKTDIIIMSEGSPTEIKPRRVPRHRVAESILAPQRDRTSGSLAFLAVVAPETLFLLEPGNSQRPKCPSLDRIERSAR